LLKQYEDLSGRGNAGGREQRVAGGRRSAAATGYEERIDI
jgi:hypothetical protein